MHYKLRDYEQDWYKNLVSAFKIHLNMAGMSASSMFVSFPILLAMAFSFFPQLIPVTAGLSTSFKCSNMYE